MGIASRFEGRELACVRGGRIVFARLAFDVTGGGLLILRGPNGAGKSSLLRVMAGLIAPAHGALIWNGEDADADPVAHRARAAYAGHDDALKPGLTVREHLAFHAALRGADARHLDVALEAFGLTALATTPARFLSAGQRKRAALARVIAAPAPIWLLDEPTNGLDAGAVAKLETAIAAHRGAGGIVVAATHLDFAGAGAATLDLAAMRAA
ncbi:MAG: heme ABC exporter ATP-binding protein CcmA [Tagaea sp.]